MTVSDLNDSQRLKSAVVRETKSSPSQKQTFFYLQNNDSSLTIVSQDEWRKKRLSGAWNAVWDFVYSVFLPVGYPESVSPDYLSWQLWNSLQDFSNTVTRALATHAVLKGAGVGDAAATPLAATITWLMKDVTGMFASIGFAYLKGSKFDCDHKKWRLFADVINDLGYMVDILSPHIACLGFAFMQCTSSLIKALVGVAGGATRASLVQHQAKESNMADIQAKDGSQETFTNMVALMFSFLIIPVVAGSQSLVIGLFSFFTLIHLFANYSGVRSLQIPVFNLSRFGICVSRFLRREGELGLRVINDLEPVWFFSACPFASRLSLGVPLNHHVNDHKFLQSLTHIYSGEKYILTIDTKGNRVNVSFDEESNHMTTLAACFQAVILIQGLDAGRTGSLDPRIASLSQRTEGTADEIRQREIQLLQKSKSIAEDMFPSFLTRVQAEGWDLSRCLVSQGEFRYSLIHNKVQ